MTSGGGQIQNCLRSHRPSPLQASFTVGPGIQRAAQLAPSAFLASAAGSSDLVRQILPLHLQEPPSLYTHSLIQPSPPGTKATMNLPHHQTPLHITRKPGMPPNVWALSLLVSSTYSHTPDDRRWGGRSHQVTSRSLPWHIRSVWGHCHTLPGHIR